MHRGCVHAVAAVALSAALAGCGSSGRAHVTAPTTSATSGRSSSPSPRTPSPSTPRVATLQVRDAPWHLTSPLSREVAFALGGRIELVGGLLGDNTSTRAVVSIDPATGTAHRVGSLAAPVHDAAGAEVAGQRFVFGGGTSASDATVQRLTAAGSVVTPTALPAPRSDLAAASVDGRAYLIGGYDGATWAKNVLRTANGTQFTAAAALPVPVRYPAVATVGSVIWVFGGQTPNGPTSVIQRIDTTTGTAAVAGRMASPLSDASAVVLDGDILLCGGTSGGHPSSAVRRFDVATGRLRTVGHLPEPVADAGSAVVGGVAYLLGGETPAATDRVVILRHGLAPTGTRKH